VTIAADGALSIGNRTVTRQQLEAEFAQIAALPEADQPIVRVRGDGGLTYQKVIDVLSLAKAKGLTKAALDSEIR
jgi:biopolymer transport protein ExbD